MMTRDELLTHLATLTPAQRRTVLTMAKTILIAREAGDTRQAETIVAHLVQPARARLVH